MESARFSESDAAYRLLQRTYNARAQPFRASDPRPPWTFGPFGAARPPRSTLASRASPFEEARRATAHPLRDGRAASHVSLDNVRLPALQARRKVGTPKVTVLRTAACGRRYEPASGCAEDEAYDDWRLRGPSRLERRTSPRLACERRMTRWLEVPLLRSCSSTPWSPTPGVARGWRLLALFLSQPRPHSRALPRRRTCLQESGCFPPPGTRRMTIARHVVRLQLAPCYAAPHSRGMGIASRGHAPLFPLCIAGAWPWRGKHPEWLGSVWMSGLSSSCFTDRPQRP